MIFFALLPKDECSAHVAVPPSFRMDHLTIIGAGTNGIVEIVRIHEDDSEPLVYALKRVKKESVSNGNSLHRVRLALVVVTA